MLKHNLLCCAGSIKKAQSCRLCFSITLRGIAMVFVANPGVMCAIIMLKHNITYSMRSSSTLPKSGGGWFEQPQSRG